MTEQKHSSHNTGGPDILRRLMQLSDGVDLINTLGRFSLVTDDKSFDVSQRVDGAVESRFLIIPAEDTVGEIEAQLEEASVFTLSPAALVDGYAIYKVPTGAKQLAEERFFPDQLSTETYTSDKELCGMLGQLWGNIYKLTGQLPASTPLKSTGMLQFLSEEVRLFPIPPYDWVSIEQPEVAKERFLDAMSEELLSPNSASGDYQALLNAASTAWPEG